MTNPEQRRLTNWRLKVLQTAVGAGNVARTCRYFAISRKTFYKWRQRYQEHGDAGLADRARSAAPLLAGDTDSDRQQDPLSSVSLTRPRKACTTKAPSGCGVEPSVRNASGMQVDDKGRLVGH